MAWERRDNIWPPDGRAGTVEDIAQRYASATRAGLDQEARSLAARVHQMAHLDALRENNLVSGVVDAASARLPWECAR